MQNTNYWKKVIKPSTQTRAREFASLVHNVDNVLFIPRGEISVYAVNKKSVRKFNKVRSGNYMTSFHATAIAAAVLTGLVPRKFITDNNLDVGDTDCAFLLDRADSAAVSTLPQVMRCEMAMAEGMEEPRMLRWLKRLGVRPAVADDPASLVQLTEPAEETSWTFPIREIEDYYRVTVLPMDFDFYVHVVWVNGDKSFGQPELRMASFDPAMTLRGGHTDLQRLKETLCTLSAIRDGQWLMLQTGTNPYTYDLIPAGGRSRRTA